MSVLTYSKPIILNYTDKPCCAGWELVLTPTSLLLLLLSSVNDLVVSGKACFFPSVNLWPDSMASMVDHSFRLGETGKKIWAYFPWLTESKVVQIRDKFAAFFGCSKAKGLSAFQGALPPWPSDQGQLCPWTLLGALRPDPHYRLALTCLP